MSRVATQEFNAQETRSEENHPAPWYKHGRSVFEQRKAHLRDEVRLSRRPGMSEIGYSSFRSDRIS